MNINYNSDWIIIKVYRNYCSPRKLQLLTSFQESNGLNIQVDPVC